MSAVVYKNIAVIGTHKNPKVAETVLELIILLNQWGLNVFLEKETALSLPGGTSQYEVLSLEALSHHCDCGVVVGGDGNLLRAGRAFSLSGKPIIGVNRGQLGYLTDIAPEKLELELKQILIGRRQVEQRFLIEGEIERNGEIIHLGSALNDIVLFPGEIAQMIEFELKINQTFVYSQRSDGLIISTPTGSTAYSLSAGGPILQPDMEALILVPMFPHTLTARPVVIDAHSEIEILISEDNKTAPRLSYDGQSHLDLSLGDKIKIKQQVKRLSLLHPESYDYYSVLRSKLQWGTQLVR